MSLTVAVGVVALSVLIILLRWCYTRNNDFWKRQGVFEIEAHKIAPLWKRLTQLVTLSEFDHATYKALGEEPYGGYIEFGKPVLVIRDLELLKRIFVKDFDHFVDRPVASISKHDKVFGKMLVSKAGKEWKDLRSAVTPAFSASKIKRMFQSFNACGHQMAKYLKQSGSLEIDFQNTFGRYTLGVIATLAFGLEADTFRSTESTYFKMVKQIQKFTPVRIAKVVLNTVWPSLVKLFQLNLSDPEAVRFFSSVVEGKMRERRETGVKHQDFLQLMLDAQEGRLNMDQKEVLNAYEKDAMLNDVTTKDMRAEFDDGMVLSQCLLFFFGGADTLESLLTFAAYELAKNPDVQEKLMDEVTEFMAENDGNISYEAVQKCEYLDMVIYETLRLHPPAFGTRRLCTSEYKLPGANVVLPVGSRVDISINGIHKDERNYPEPMKFNPENFNAENKASRHSYSWLPFGQGPRNCIAMRFALMEAKAALAHLVFNFKIEPCARTPNKLKFKKWSTILKPAGGMWLKFTPRKVPEAEDSLS